MIRSMFTEVDKLNRGMDAAWRRNEVIANNIANVDTPDFKRSTVAFEDYYKSALSGETEFTMKRTRAKHMDNGRMDAVGYTVQTDTSTTMRMDGNNVDIDKEMSDLAQSVIYYQTLQSKVSSELQQLSIAIKGQ
ncbi:flagellar basal body rod protein FlgB [Christensenellaceae bacterium OttesenSCG-928-M15]|nr:flagellar basal body rod protein FlgB [Christensenellaceae bacterium OttesenSCG-928-M15]